MVSFCSLKGNLEGFRSDDPVVSFTYDKIMLNESGSVW